MGIDGIDILKPDDFAPKTVPLVVYEEDGTRRVVGEATITPSKDGLHIAGRVSDPQLQKLVEQNLTNPKFEKEI